MGNFYMFNRKPLGAELLIKQILSHFSNDSLTYALRELGLPAHDLSDDHLQRTRASQ